MKFLRTLRDQVNGRRNASAASETESDGDGERADAQPPFPGYDGLNDRKVMDELSKHSQVELEAVETYERSHKNRPTVLYKLRYMRGAEPLPGYDAMSVPEIVAVLEEADITVIKRVRGYERKFANRPDVLDTVTRVHHAHQAAHPAAPPPAYQSASAAAAG
jgi:hypothetical protein